MAPKSRYAGIVVAVLPARYPATNVTGAERQTAPRAMVRVGYKNPVQIGTTGKQSLDKGINIWQKI
jgi:hypothetical protein